MRVLPKTMYKITRERDKGCPMQRNSASGRPTKKMKKIKIPALTRYLGQKNMKKNNLNCKNYREKCIPRLKKFINEKLKGCKVGHWPDIGLRATRNNNVLEEPKTQNISFFPKENNPRWRLWSGQSESQPWVICIKSHGNIHPVHAEWQIWMLKYYAYTDIFQSPFTIRFVLGGVIFSVFSPTRVGRLGCEPVSIVSRAAVSAAATPHSRD